MFTKNETPPWTGGAFFIYHVDGYVLIFLPSRIQQALLMFSLPLYDCYFAGHWHYRVSVYPHYHLLCREYIISMSENNWRYSRQELVLYGTLLIVQKQRPLQSTLVH
jgi:hypothetical protein